MSKQDPHVAPEVSDTSKESAAGPKVNFLSGTSHGRDSVGLRGVAQPVDDRGASDGETPPPAGCPCSSGF